MSPAGWVGLVWAYLRLSRIEKRERAGWSPTPAEQEWIARRAEKYARYR